MEFLLALLGKKNAVLTDGRVKFKGVIAKFLIHDLLNHSLRLQFFTVQIQMLINIYFSPTLLRFLSIRACRPRLLLLSTSNLTSTGSVMKWFAHVWSVYNIYFGSIGNERGLSTL